MPHGVLGEEDVEGKGDRRPERGDHAERVEAESVPQVDDERQSAEGEDERGPDAPPDGLLRHESSPERDQDRREVLDEQRDSDLKPVDREEVEPLDEREPEDAERDEEEELAPADAQTPGLRDRKRHGECDGGPGRPHLRQPRRREAGAEDRLRDRPVDTPHAGRGEHHRVAEQRAPNMRLLARGEDRFCHAARLSDYTLAVFGV